MWSSLSPCTVIYTMLFTYLPANKQYFLSNTTSQPIGCSSMCVHLTFVETSILGSRLEWYISLSGPYRIYDHTKSCICEKHRYSFDIIMSTFSRYSFSRPPPPRAPTLPHPTLPQHTHAPYTRIFIDILLVHPEIAQLIWGSIKLM